MPWTVADVPRFKKGLTSAQKKKWVSIANGVLKSCESSGDSGCEGKAIRIANSKFTKVIIFSEEKKMETKLPKGALRFVDQGCHAYAQLAEGEEGKPRMKMVAYSGGIIPDHWYWDNLAIDLAGIKFNQKRYPILEEHDTTRKIAHMSKPLIEDGKLVVPEDVKFLETEAADEFVKNTSTSPPFPYQASIYAKPLSVERLEEGADAEVNGYKFKGPGTIWRECEFREASVCVFGWDSKTTSSAFSREEQEDVDYSEKELTVMHIDGKPKLIRRKEVSKTMKLDELKEQFPDLFTEVVQLGVTQGITQAEESFKEKETQFNTTVASINDRLESTEKKNLVLEKKDIERSVRELKATSREIWMEKLSASKVPERYFDKVIPHVSHESFMEDGVLDEAKFGEAIDAEIKDWEEKGITETVIGSGLSSREPTDDVSDEDKATLKENDEKTTSRLLSLAGQPQKKED